MAKKKTGPPKVEIEVADEPAIRHARIELPEDDYERVRAVAKSLGLSVTSFIRMATLKEARRVEEGRD